MSERFDTIRKFSPTSQILSCPVEIYKGAILFDKEKKDCVLQLKLRNISSNNIKSIIINITCYDDDGVELDDYLKQYKYSNLDILDKQCFGDMEAIYLNNQHVDNVDIYFKKVIYINGDVYELDENELPITTREQKLISDELLNQFHTVDNHEHHELRIYHPIQCDYTMWQCSCGKLNDTKICNRCGIDRNWIFENADENMLNKRLQDYLDCQNKLAEASRIEMERKIQYNKNQRKRILIILSTIIVITILYFSLSSLTNFVLYKYACEKLDDSNYTEAIKIYKKLPLNYNLDIKLKYKDKLKQLFMEYQNENISFDEADTGYEQLREYVDEEFYEENYNILRILKDSKMNFNSATIYEKGKDYFNAIKCYNYVNEKYDASNYKKAQERIKELENAVIKEALIRLEKYKSTDNYENALDFIDDLNSIGVKSDDIKRYDKYFKALDNGNYYMNYGIYLSRYDDYSLYNTPDDSSQTGNRVSVTYGNRCTVYDYHVSSDNVLWLKISIQDEGFQWIKANGD